LLTAVLPVFAVKAFENAVAEPFSKYPRDAFLGVDDVVNDAKVPPSPAIPVELPSKTAQNIFPFQFCTAINRRRSQSMARSAMNPVL
jgi:hypothetical protein